MSHLGMLDHGGHGRRVRAVARRRGRDGASRGLVLLVAHLERAFGVAEGSARERARLEGKKTKRDAAAEALRSCFANGEASSFQAYVRYLILLRDDRFGSGLVHSFVLGIPPARWSLPLILRV